MAAITKQQFNDICEFLLNNTHLFKKPNKTWIESMNKIKESGVEVYPLMGKCFPSAKFCQIFGGPENVSLHCIPSKKLPFINLDGKVMNTTHWFAKDRQTGEVYDPTIGQFIYEPYNVEYVKALYEIASERDFGGKYRNGVALPSKEVMLLAEEFKKIYGYDGKFDEWR